MDNIRVEKTGSKGGGRVVFRATVNGSTTIVEGRGIPYIWKCECKEFHDTLRTGVMVECAHIRACIASLRRDPRRIVNPLIPGMECPAGHNAVRSCGNSTVRGPLYKCDECSREFAEMDRPRRPERAAPEPLVDPGLVHACTGCGGTARTKAGIQGDKQMYRCKDCNRRYVVSEPGFANNKYPPEVISSTLNKIMSGMSYRKTSEDIYGTTGVRIPHNTIIRWATKYTSMIKAHVDALRPITGNVWSVDEAYLNVRGSQGAVNRMRGNWLWSAIDPRTRLLLCTRIAEGTRGIPDAEAVLEAAKAVAAEPDYIVTDSHGAYGRAARRQVPRAAHIKTNSIKDGFTNMAIERYHNEIREKLKSCRGLNTADSAQLFCDLLRIHHNFVRPHMGLDGRTPAEAAGMAGPEFKSGKYRALIRASAPKGLAAKLGDLLEYVHIRNRGQVTIEPKEWLKSEDWKRLHEMLTGMGFRWMFSGIARHWILFQHTAPVQGPEVRYGRRTPV